MDNSSLVSFHLILRLAVVHPRKAPLVDAGFSGNADLEQIGVSGKLEKRAMEVLRWKPSLRHH
ncbi:MAG: hypothetical protein EHM36_03110 [Deltaproteobacteria bacterium]|nr:MAG: hypothetical protein EHM36_03110 [Deltaproteobacteria bacterium]